MKIIYSLITDNCSLITEKDEPELTNIPQPDSNPFLQPELEGLIEKRISEDIWESMKGELPCVVASEECIKQLQQLGIQNNRGLKELEQKIEEANGRIDEAKTRNEQSISISTFSPFFQAYLQDFRIFRSGPTQNLPNNPFELIFSNLASTFLGNSLAKLMPLDQLFPQDGAATRSIAIADLQIKVAELQRIKAELGNKIRQQILDEALKLEEIAREFQIQQEIAKRDKARIEYIKVSYEFGEGTSESYLGQLSAYDRQKAATWKEWSRLRSQLARVKLLVLGTGEEQ